MVGIARRRASFVACVPQGRDPALDAFKGLLVLGMVLAHLLQILHVDPAAADSALSRLANLLSFSGFLFAFGWGLARTSVQPRGRPRRASLRALALIAAYYLLAAASDALYRQPGHSPAALTDLLLLNRLPPYSEFMASFAALALLLVPFRRAVLALCRELPGATLLTSLALAVGAPPLSAPPQLAPLIPVANVLSFPLLAYLPWFLAGVCYAAHGGERSWRAWAAALVASAPLAALSLAGQEALRFPPSPAWVLGPAALLLAYAALCDRLAAWGIPGAALGRIGSAPLTHLIVATLAIFLLFHFRGRILASDAEVALALGLLVLAGCAVDSALRRVVAFGFGDSPPRRAFG